MNEMSSFMIKSNPVLHVPVPYNVYPIWNFLSTVAADGMAPKGACTVIPTKYIYNQAACNWHGLNGFMGWQRWHTQGFILDAIPPHAIELDRRWR